MRSRRVLLLPICVLVLAGGALLPGARSVYAAPLTGVTTVSAGQDHTCALTTAGGVECWGKNTRGQLGDSGACGVVCAVPVGVSGLSSGVAGISAGYEHTCAVTSGGGVKCWGVNQRGQLGNGANTGPQQCGTVQNTFGCSSTPVDVSGLTSGVAAVSAGPAYNCVLTTAGGVKCWGSNDSGQLGNGTITQQGCYCIPTPVDVSGLTSGVAAISTAYDNACALLIGGNVKCWGPDWTGQLGDGQACGTDFSAYCAPVDLSSLNGDATSISAAGSAAGCVGFGVGVGVAGVFPDCRQDGGHTCVVTATGGVQCWGQHFGTTPADVAGLTGGVSAVSAGRDVICALLLSGGVKCWGSNYSGQLGNGTTTDSVTAPVDVSGPPGGFTAVSAGYDHVCAVTSSAGVMCWGGNLRGELGDGTTTNHSLPVDVLATARYQPGDVSCDGATNSVDALFVLQWSAELTGTFPCVQNMDVNRDRRIDAVDAAFILQYAAGLIHSLPA